MRPIYWNSGVRWGDVNARWGSPAYLLEPGDAGYVPDPRSASFPATNPQPRNKHMPKADYLKKQDLAFSQQLNTFKNNIGPKAALLGLSPAQVAAQAADAERFEWELIVQDVLDNAAQSMTSWKEATRRGGSPSSPAIPTAPVFPTPEPTPVAPGVEARFRALVGLIKKHPNYTPAIGEVLGIEGEAHARPDPAGFKPVLELKLTGGQVLVIWGWQGNRAFLSSLEIQVDRGDGAGFVLLSIDTTPKYLDTAPMPATAKTWKYKAIYHEGDARVGQWSDVVSINVAP